MQRGKHTYGNIIERSWGEGATLSVGNFCSIADDVEVFLGGNHRTDWVTTYPFSHVEGWKDEFRYIQGHPATKGDVIILNDVWIGAHVTIMSGTIIGDGAVIGARSVVSGNIPPYSIWAGNPARFIKFRFSPEQITALLEIEWWYWNDEKIKKFVPILMSGNIDEFIKRAKSWEGENER